MKNSHWLTNITETDIENDNFLSASTSSKYDHVDSIKDLQFATGKLSEDSNKIDSSYLDKSSS